MITVRPAEGRGHSDFGWLDSRHSFSFGDYHDPDHQQFGSLRVINEDRVAPGRGFDTHPHRDMEIITYVLAGELAHRDSLGTGSVIRAGEVQRMSAGTGIQHSEFNASFENPAHFLQIWILPERRGLPPGYEQKSFSENDCRDRLCLLVSRSGRAGSLTIHQDVEIYAAAVSPGGALHHALDARRCAWVQVTRGRLTLNGVELHQGDGAALRDEAAIQLISEKGADLLLFNLAHTG